MEDEIRELKATNEGQIRLIQNVTGHSKNQSAVNDTAAASASGVTVLEKVAEESERNERLAKQLTRSKFLALSENPPTALAQDIQHPLLKTNWQVFGDKNRGYLTDDKVPPQIYTLI